MSFQHRLGLTLLLLSIFVLISSGGIELLVAILVCSGLILFLAPTVVI